MEHLAGIFEHDAAFDGSDKIASRKAAAVAHKRAKDQFGAFLAQADGDFHQRFALIEDELAQVVDGVNEEYGGDAETILASVTSVLAAGGFCDDCRSWKSGPKAGCTCGDDSSESETDDDAESEPAEDSDDDAAEVKEARTATWVVSEFRPTAEALETEKLPTGDDTALGGPSPKIDKKEWKPNALNDDGNLSPIDTEGAGSPHPTEQQDVTDVADHEADFLAQTDAVTESQDVGKETTTEAIHTDTWSGTEGQADPVTSAAHDPELNPLRTMIQQGIIPQTQVEAAISAYEARA